MVSPIQKPILTRAGLARLLILSACFVGLGIPGLSILFAVLYSDNSDPSWFQALVTIGPAFLGTGVLLALWLHSPILDDRRSALWTALLFYCLLAFLAPIVFAVEMGIRERATWSSFLHSIGFMVPSTLPVGVVFGIIGVPLAYAAVVSTRILARKLGLSA